MSFLLTLATDRLSFLLMRGRIRNEMTDGIVERYVIRHCLQQVSPSLLLSRKLLEQGFEGSVLGLLKVLLESTEDLRVALSVVIGS